jgi:hypothetical protein
VTGYPSTADYGLYYDRLYAYWSYTLGDGWYTQGDFADTVHTGDGAGSNGNTNWNNPTGSDNEDAFHAHVAAFIDASKSNPGSLTGGTATGSSSTEVWSGAAPAGWPAAGLSDVPGSGAGGMANNCGASPACAPGGGSCGTSAYGPVFRAP